MNSVNDLLSAQDEYPSHKVDFVLWPRMWQTYRTSLGLSWHLCQLSSNNRNGIPSCSGIYTFLVQPMLFDHPACSYLMYVGQSSNLNRRFGEYLTTEKRISGRPKIFRMLNKYPDNLWFCYTSVPQNELSSVEDRLTAAYMPPFNDQFPAEVRRIVGAFR